MSDGLSDRNGEGVCRGQKHLTSLQEEHRRGSMKGTICTSPICLLVRKSNQRPEFRELKKDPSSGRRTPECINAGKVVVLPLPSLLLPHQSRKEPGMKGIKAAFRGTKKKSAGERREEE